MSVIQQIISNKEILFVKKIALNIMTNKIIDSRLFFSVMSCTCVMKMYLLRELDIKRY